MRREVGIVCSLIFVSSLYADKNWIPIQPIPFEPLPAKVEQNTSRAPATAIENLKRLQRLMDKQNSVDGVKKDTAKNWYLFEEPTEN